MECTTVTEHVQNKNSEEKENSSTWRYEIIALTLCE